MANPLRSIAEIPIRTIQTVAGGGNGSDAAEVRGAVDAALRPLSAQLDALQREVETLRGEVKQIREDTDHIRTEQARVAAEGSS